MLTAEAPSEADLVQFCSGIFTGDEPLSERLVNEARFGLSRILPILANYDLKTAEVVEIGAGTCILSAYLASKGVRQTAVEPLGPEFDFFTTLQARVVDHCKANDIPLRIVRATGETLDIDGRFDVAYTINALEHMREPLLTLDNMYRALKPNGTLLAHCPNYSVPFDSHFGAVLITRSKALNGWLYRARIKEYPQVWDELNFIRYPDIRRHMKGRGWNFSFSNTVVRDMVDRVIDDPVFRARMPSYIRAIGTIMKTTRLDRMLDFVPPHFQSPMEVVVRKPT